MKYVVGLDPMKGKSENEKLHHHQQNCIILLVLCGSGTFLIDQIVYSFAPNSLFIIPAATLHLSHSMFPDYKRYIVHFPTSVLAECSTKETDFFPFFREPRHMRLSDEQAAAIQGWIEQSAPPNDTSAFRFGNDIRCEIAFLQLLLTVCDYIDQPEQAVDKVENKECRIAPILQYIQTNLSEPLTLDAVASALYRNKYYLCHLFKQETGITLGSYILRSRLHHAQELLRMGRSVQQAAEESGFGNYAHFIRAFGQQVGMPPGKYARRFHKTNP